LSFGVLLALLLGRLDDLVRSLAGFNVTTLGDLELSDLKLNVGDDLVSSLLESVVDSLADDFVDEVLGVEIGGDLSELDEQTLTESADLRGLGVRVELNLAAASVSDGGDEDAENDAIVGLNFGHDLDQGLSLLKHRRNSLASQFVAVEGGEARATLNFIDSDLDSLGDILGGVGDVSIRHFGDAVLQEVGDDLSTSRLLAASPSDRLGVAESSGGNNREPLLLEEGVLVTFLDDLAFLRELFVLAFSHLPLLAL